MVNGESERATGLERLVFFSDAVFAIAITLLALDVRLPDTGRADTDETLLAALSTLWPSLFAFTISFVVIAAFWLGHYRTFRVVVRADPRLIGLNFAFLFCIALLPFPTSVVARDGDLRTAAILYAGFVLVLGLLSVLMWVYATRIGRLVAESVTPAIARRITYRTSIIPVVFGLSIPIALVNPYVAEASWVGAAVVQAVATRVYRVVLDAPDGRARGG